MDKYVAVLFYNGFYNYKHCDEKSVCWRVYVIKSSFDEKCMWWKFLVIKSPWWKVLLLKCPSIKSPRDEQHLCWAVLVVNSPFDEQSVVTPHGEKYRNSCDEMSAWWTCPAMKCPFGESTFLISIYHVIDQSLHEIFMQIVIQRWIVNLVAKHPN